MVWYVVCNESRGVLMVAFLDVGQGDAIFIESPVGNQVLIDGGANRSVLRELGDVMPFYDRSIDVLIATHSDQDHIGGLADVLETYSVQFILESSARAQTASYQIFDRLSGGELGSVRASIHRGHVIDIGGGAYIRVLAPTSDQLAGESNTGSIVLQVVFGNTAFLLTGDAPHAVENQLIVLDGESLTSDVLKAGHHGSRTSNGEYFVRTVAPQYVVISAGRDNTYGHPHEEVLNIFNSIGVEVLGTYENGAAVFESDGEEVSLVS